MSTTLISLAISILGFGYAAWQIRLEDRQWLEDFQRRTLSLSKVL